MRRKFQILKRNYRRDGRRYPEADVWRGPIERTRLRRSALRLFGTVTDPKGSSRRVEATVFEPVPEDGDSSWWCKIFCPEICDDEIWGCGGDAEHALELSEALIVDVLSEKGFHLLERRKLMRFRRRRYNIYVRQPRRPLDLLKDDAPGSAAH
jgi:hypothetical protein